MHMLYVHSMSIHMYVYSLPVKTYINIYFIQRTIIICLEFENNTEKYV